MKSSAYAYLFYIALCACLICQSTEILAQNDKGYKLKGKVIDLATGLPLDYATISVFTRSDSALITGGITQEDGQYEIAVQNARPSALYLIVEFIGYQSTTIDPLPVSRSAQGQVYLADLGLNAEALSIDGVEVRAERSELQIGLDKQVYNVGKDLANQGGSAEDILDNIPAVAVDIEGNVTLRGASGVRILINGQPSGLDNRLKALQANLIERIEIVTNPSARYEAEGTAGLINIILKKERAKGFNGSFDANIGDPLRYGLGANVNYRQRNINWFASYAIQYRESEGGGDVNTTVIRPDTTLVTDQTREFNRSGWNHTLRFGLDYYFDEKTSLTGSVLYQDANDDNLNTNVYRDFINSYPDELSSLTEREDDEREDETELAYNLTLKKEYNSREHTLTVALNYEDEMENEGSAFVEEVMPVGGTPSTIIQRSANDEGTKQWVLSADYVHPLGKDHRFELGLRGSYREIVNEFNVETQDETSKWVELEEFTNDFDYDEYIAAAYAQYGNKLGRFTYQLGLRTEFADIQTLLAQTDERNTIENLQLFPSGFVTYNINDANKLQANFSRRIRRPHFFHLNPFFTFNDSRNFFVGNPQLQPSLGYNYELNHLLIREKVSLTTGLFYRHTNDVIQRIRSIDEIGRTTLRPENLNHQNDYGFSVTANYSGLQWLKSDLTVNLLRSETDGQNIQEGFLVTTDTWTARWTVRVTPWKKSNLQIRGNYRGPRETVQGETKSITSVDLGFSQDLLPKKNLTLTLSVRDLFNSRKRRYIQSGAGFITDGEFQWQIRTVTLSANYRINQKKQRGGRSDGGTPGGEGI